MAGCAAVVGGLSVAALVAALAAADEPPASASTAVGACTECTDGGAPSMEMLLYLAEFGDAEDRYVDPAEVAAQLEEAKNAAPNDERRTDDAETDAPPPVDR